MFLNQPARSLYLHRRKTIIVRQLYGRFKPELRLMLFVSDVYVHSRFLI
jgi:hypothetical protein